MSGVTAANKHIESEGKDMPKGLDRQVVAILLRSAIPIQEIEPLLTGRKIVKRMDAWEEGWQGPSLVVEFRPEVNGHVIVDVVGAQWPDHMGGNPGGGTEFFDPQLFRAWSMGHFGPFAFPFGLQRALQQSWHWEEAAGVVAVHTAFLRLRLTYVFGALHDPDAPMAPQDCNPLAELGFLTDMARDVMNHPDALCYFNPSGEVLATSEHLRTSLAHFRDHDLPPWPLWCNVRLFRVDEQWSFMDSVGNWQLDMPDHEAAFPADRFSADDVAAFIGNASLYVLHQGQVIKDGDTMDCPGHINWQAKCFENALSEPPRGTIRWLPAGQSDVPEVFLGACEEETSSQRNAATPPFEEKECERPIGFIRRLLARVLRRPTTGSRGHQEDALDLRSIAFWRKENQSVIINDNEIVVTVVRIQADEVQLRIGLSTGVTVTSHKLHESVTISDDVSVTVLELPGDSVQLGFQTSKEVVVHRREVYEAIKRQAEA